MFRIGAHLLALAAMLVGDGVQAQSSAAAANRDTNLLAGIRMDTLLDLPTVIARAIDVNPAVALGEATLRTARSEERVARGAYLPSLTASSSLLQTDVTTVPGIGGTGSSASAGIASSLSLFTGGRRGADRVRAAADSRFAEAYDVTQRFAVTLAAQRAFYEALRGTDLLVVADARVSRAERGLRYAQDRMRAGTATRSDELRARLELTSGRQQLLAARDTLQSAAYALGRLVGREGPVGAIRPASLDPRVLAQTDSEIVRLAVDAAPTVLSAEAQARASDAAIRSARAQYLPDVRLTGGYNVANPGQPAVIGAARQGWQLAVGTSYPLFNGYLREDAVTRAEAAADVARSASLDARRSVRADAGRLVSALHFAEQNIGLAGEAAGAAREDLRVQTERYRAGISTALDQLTSELAVTQAELGLVAARYSYQTTRAALEALLGRAL